MTDKLRANLTLAQFLAGLLVALVPVLVSLGAFLASVQTQGQAIEEIRRERRETLAEWRPWREDVDAERVTLRAGQAEILRRLERIEQKLDR